MVCYNQPGAAAAAKRENGITLHPLAAWQVGAVVVLQPFLEKFPDLALLTINRRQLQQKNEKWHRFAVPWLHCSWHSGGVAAAIFGEAPLLCLIAENNKWDATNNWGQLQ